MFTGQKCILHKQLWLVCHSSFPWLQLEDIGLSLLFVLDGLLAKDMEAIIQSAGNHQIEAVRHRASVSMLLLVLYVYCVSHVLLLLQGQQTVLYWGGLGSSLHLLRWELESLTCLRMTPRTWNLHF